MPGLRKVALTVAAGVAVWAAGHVGVWAVIGYCWLAAVSGTKSAKPKANEQRIAGLVPAVNRIVGAAQTRIGNLSGQFTTTNGLTDGTINGSSASAGLTNGTISGTSGGASAGTAHTHGGGSYAVTSGQHSHGAGGYAVSNGTHAHTLPLV